VTTRFVKKHAAIGPMGSAISSSAFNVRLASRVDALSLGRGAQSLQCYYNYVTASVIA
jgi:hypothetical protein